MAGGSRFEPNDYFCEECKIKFEEFQLREERDFAPCPNCGKPVPRIMSIGGGWLDCVDGVNARVQRDVKEMQAKINKRDEKFITNLRGPEKWEK